MFEATKVGRSVSKEDFTEQQKELRTQLLDIQRQLGESRTAVVVIISGVEAAGKGEVVNRLNEWLDTRGVQTFAFWDESDEERERPRYWRFWRTLPPRGSLAILFGGWYLAPIEHRFQDICTDAEVDAELNRIVDFERMLIQDGALIVKSWCHLSEKDQKRRLKELSRDDRSRWKMLPDKAKFSEHYSKFESVAERVIRHTDRGIAPWYLIEAQDRRYRDLTIGKTLLHAIRSRLSEPVRTEPPSTLGTVDLPEVPSAQITLLDQLDLTQALDREEYRVELARLQLWNGQIDESVAALEKAVLPSMRAFMVGSPCEQPWERYTRRGRPGQAPRRRSINPSSAGMISVPLDLRSRQPCLSQGIRLYSRPRRPGHVGPARTEREGVPEWRRR